MFISLVRAEGSLPQPLKTPICADVQRTENQEYEIQAAASVRGQDGLQSHPFNTAHRTAWTAYSWCRRNSRGQPQYLSLRRARPFWAPERRTL